MIYLNVEIIRLSIQKTIEPAIAEGNVTWRDTDRSNKIRYVLDGTN